MRYILRQGCQERSGEVCKEVICSKMKLRLVKENTLKRIYILLLICFGVFGCSDPGIYIPEEGDNYENPVEETDDTIEPRIIDLDSLHVDISEIKSVFHIEESDYGPAINAVLFTNGSVGTLDFLDESNNPLPDGVISVNSWQQIGFDYLLLIVSVTVDSFNPEAPTSLTSEYQGLSSLSLASLYILLDITPGALSVFHPGMWGIDFQIVRDKIIWRGNVTEDTASSTQYLIATDLATGEYTRLTNPNLYDIDYIAGVTPTDEVIIVTNDSMTSEIEASLVTLNGDTIVEISSGIQAGRYFYAPNGDLFMGDWSSPPYSIYRVERSGSSLSYPQVETDDYNFSSAFDVNSHASGNWLDSPSIRIDDSQIAFLEFIGNVPTVSVNSFNSTSPISSATSFSSYSTIWHKNSTEVYQQTYGSLTPTTQVMDNLTGLLNDYYADDLMFYSNTVGINTYTHLLETDSMVDTVIFNDDFDPDTVKVFFTGN